MSWSCVPTKLRIATHPAATISGPLYKNGSLLNYFWGSSRVISDSYGYSLKVGSRPAAVNNTYSYSGYAGFYDGSYSIWKDPNFGWVISTLEIGTPCLEYWVWTDPANHAAGGSYYGNSFYTIGSGTGSGSFPSLGATPTAYGRGSLRGTTSGGTSSTTLSISTTWQYWTAPAGGYGKYTAAGTASGDKYFGSPQWTHSSILYTRSPTATDGYYSYGDIAWNSSAGAYVLGTYVPDPGTETTPGWWQSASAPTSGDSWVLTFTKTSASEVTGSDITLTWNDYVLGLYSTECSVFRADRLGG